MSIGLDFVKNIDKNWKKHVRSLDRVKEETIIEEIDYFKKFKNNNISKNIENEDLNVDYWSYWKKRYSIMR